MGFFTSDFTLVDGRKPSMAPTTAPGHTGRGGEKRGDGQCRKEEETERRRGVGGRKWVSRGGGDGSPPVFTLSISLSISNCFHASKFGVIG